MGRTDNESEYYLNSARISRVSLVRTILMTVIFIAVFTVGLKNSSIVVRAEEPTVNGVTLTERIKQGWDNYETEINLVNYRVPSEDFINYYHSAFFSDSKYFYVGFEKVSMFTNFDGTVYSVKVEYISDDAEYIKSMIAQYNNAMDICISGMDKSWSDLEKLIYINDYLVGLCEYDLNADHRYDAYGALVGHKAVCQGYSMAFKALAEKVGIPCYIVSSDQKNHAWNIVKLNGRFYMLDVTWNDVSENTLGYQKYKFFLKSENWFKSEYGEHCADDYEIHGAKVTPVADDNYYDDYFWSSAGSGLYIYLKFVDGQWYGTDGAGKIIKYSCNGKDMTAEEGAIVDLSQVFWWIPGEHQGYYAVTAMKIASYGKNLLYSTPKQIMMYDSETGKATPVYTLTDEEQAVGCIYGIYVTNDGNIEYLVSKSLRSADLETGTTKTVPVTYKATFDWSEDCSEATVKISSYPIESFSTTIPNVSSSIVLEDATCTENGLATYTVSVDYIGTTYTETKEKVIEAKGHKEVKDAAVAPTCTDTGLTEGSHCSVCKTVIKRQETIDAVGHDWDEGVITTPSTCKSKGEKTFTCKREGCNATRKEEVPFADHIQGNPVRENEVAVSCTNSGSYDEVIYCTVCKAELSREKKEVAVIGHSWDEGTVTTPAGCTTDGVKTYRCTRPGCNETRNETINAQGHKEVKDAAVAPTCTDTGLTEGSHCSVCKMVIKRQETIEAIGHDWDEGVITTPSTCKSKGERTFTCKREGCNATRKEEVPFADHIQGNPVRENEVAVSCTSSGSYDEVIYCTVCKAELSREKKEVAVIGHSWDEGTVTTPAGCTTDGVKTFRCTRPGCNETKNETIKAQGHKEVKDAAVAPTCTDTGLTEGSHCSVCKMVIKAQETVDALDHDWNEGVITTPSTCIRKGVKTFTCKRDGCNATKTEEVPLADHIQGKPVKENEVSESCTSSGSYDEVIYCTVCKAELSRTHKDVDAAGHSWDKGTVTTPAGCTTDGVKTFRCTRPGCNETKYETIKALGHNVVIDRAVVPTYTSTGLTQGSHCSRCKTVFVKQEEVPKLELSGGGNQQTTPGGNQQTTPGENKPENKVTQPGIGTVSADGIVLTDTEGIKYLVSTKLTSSKVKNNIQVADQRADCKYKITKITRKRGRIIAGNVTYLGPYNKNCTKAVIPDTVKICGVKFNVTAVNKNAFKKCKQLTKVSVGKYVSSIGEKCFFGCNNLKTVTVKTKRLKTVGKNAFKGINSKAVIRVPKNYIDKYTKLVAKGKAPKGVKVTK